MWQDMTYWERKAYLEKFKCSTEAKVVETTKTGHLGLSDEELTEVDEWATAHGVSRCQAMRALILRGLA